MNTDHIQTEPPYIQGQIDADNGIDLASNPYQNASYSDAWERGWLKAVRERAEELPVWMEPNDH